MLFSFLDAIFRFLRGEAFLIGVLWMGLAAVTVGLLILMRTRWGQARPIRKCLILSLIAHILFIGYAATVQIGGPCAVHREPMVARVEIVVEPEETPEPPRPEPAEPEPWEAFARSDEQAAAPQPEESPRIESPVKPDREAAPAKSSPLPSHSLVDPPSPPTAADSGASASPPRAAPAHPAEPRSDPRRAEPPPLSGPPEPAVTAEGAADLAQARPVVRQTPPERVDPAPAEEPAVTSEPAPERMEPYRRVAPAGEGEPIDRMQTESREAILAPPAAAALVPVEPRLGSARFAAVPRSMEQFREDIPLVGPPKLPGQTPSSIAQTVPAVYRLRFEENRLQGTAEWGANEETEAAVAAALAWLVANQETDGRWSCTRHGGGREDKVDGSDREMAGVKADTGITGLALLALLGSGNTHETGPYRQAVAAGLDYLVRSQAPNGNLRGDAGTYAGMYCHAMASLAMAEAYVLSGDLRLKQPLCRALDYTLAAQDAKTGGWRYYPGDPGDTSQLGWQILLLKSAEAAGIPIPRKTREGAIRFLRSVSSGPDGGLAAYRPNMRPTLTMTAEAMVCRQFLGMPPESPTAIEAAEYLMTGLPEQGEVNLYYWYYATIGLHQLQDAHWRRWNASLQRVLLGSRRTDGDFAGSWDPNCKWGCYGGRVYSTAMAALCLEAYYRYRPLHELDDDGIAERQPSQSRR